MTQNNLNSAHIIVIGNEKGGTGKSTIAMHLAVKLMMEKYQIAVIDLDGHQGSLSKYIENRRIFCENNNVVLPIPLHYRFEPTTDYSQISSELQNLDKTIKDLSQKVDAIIIDTPGHKNYLFEAAHKYADTLITPITDSFIDLNSIADIDPANGQLKNPGHYANFIWEIKKQLASQGKPYLNWIVCGNKTSTLRSRNKNFIFEVLTKLGKLYGFRFCTGLKDRVIYRELFLDGITVLDMQHEALKRKMNVSHLAAKLEIKELAEFICP
ncbi:MAG: ATPase [Alphaproteobacteria bacterium]|nr:ATPase [Alphaproteobacteria bacterium]